MENRGKSNHRRTYRKTLFENTLYSISNEIYRKKKEEEKKLNPDKDTENRKKLWKRIKEYKKRGLTQEEAVDLIMQDKEVLEQFSYLERNGLDIRQCILDRSNKIFKEQQSSLEQERS